MLRSFRARLIIAFCALFAAISVAVSFAGLLLREQQIRNIFDNELHTRAQGIREAINKVPVLTDESLQAVIADLGRQIYFRDFYVQVYNDADERIARSANLKDGYIALRRPAKDSSKDDVIYEGVPEAGSLPPDGPSRLRGLRVRFTRPDGRQYIAIIATDPVYVTESISALRWVFLGGNAGGLVAAAGAGWLVTGAMQRRMQLIREQVKTFGPDDLTRRITMRDRDEITELTRHLNQMLDRLQAGFETQERFIHDASHELKTPVATVQAEAQAMLYGEPSKEELIEFARSTNDEMRRLGRLTEALLLLTRTNESVVTSRFKPADMTEITIAAIKHLSLMATDHQVKLHLIQEEGVSETLLVRCDSELLEAMLSNLIRNAIRFSPRKSEIRITVASSGDALEVSVEDEGPGIPPDVLPRIFDRYFQTSQTKIRRGAGLGLAIASTVAKLHAGVVTATSRAGGGARFTVRLPRLKAEMSTI